MVGQAGGRGEGEEESLPGVELSRPSGMGLEVGLTVKVRLGMETGLRGCGGVLVLTGGGQEGDLVV